MAKKLLTTPVIAVAGALAGLAGYHRYRQIKPGDTVTVPVEAIRIALASSSAGQAPFATGPGREADSVLALFQNAKAGEPVRVRVIAVTGGTFTANPLLGDNSAVPLTLTLPLAQATNTTPGLFAKK